MNGATFRFDTLAVPHAISTRQGGVSPAPYASLNLGFGVPDDERNVCTNRRLFLERVDVDRRRVVAARLSHGKEVSVFDRSRPDRFPVRDLPVRAGSTTAVPFFDADGTVSNVPGLYFLITFADCVPLLFFDPVRRVLGAAHAGWRGTAWQIASAVVRSMRERFDSRPEDIQAAIGPSVGPCCYTVGPEVVQTFGQRGAEPVAEERDGKVYLDLWATNRRQLEAAGVRSIENPRLCTACHVDTFFSHRGEGGRTGRFAMVAGLPDGESMPPVTDGGR